MTSTARPALFESVLRQYPEEKELHERVRLYLNICERQATPKEAAPQTQEERLYAATLAINGGRYDQALANLRLVRDEDPDNDHALYMLAVAHAQRGEPAEAIAHLERAIALNPENRALAKSDPDLEPLRADDAFRTALDTPAAPRARPPPPPPFAHHALGEAIIRVGPSSARSVQRCRRPHRRPRGRHGHAPQVGAPQSAASRGRRADDRARPRGRAGAAAALGDGRRRPSGRRRKVCAVGAARSHLCGPGATARHGPRPADGRARPAAGRRGTVILLSGDVPLLTPKTLQALLDRHHSTGAAATVLTAVVEAPHGYGRIVRSGEQIARIVEERDATPAERDIREINSGIYAFALEGLFDAVRGIATENAQREYYLPDLVAIFRQLGRGVETMTVANPDEIRGINSRAELAEVSRIVRQEKNNELMAAGVTIEDPATTYVDRSVAIAADTILHPGVSLEGQTTIGAGCEIHSGARIVDSRIGDRVTILNHCVITGSTIGNDVSVGPFAHLRPEADVRDRAKVGNFVELKRTVLGSGSKAMHLAYLGDATIGEKVNVGAGTITCNYDGVNEEPDGDRGRRLHRQRHAARRAGHGQAGRLRRQRHDRARRRARRRAGGQRRQAAQHRALGRGTKKKREAQS